MSKNPFDDDYDYTGATSMKAPKSYTTPAREEDDANYYEREIEKYLQESLDSTERSRQHLESSEKLGVDTAHELLAQREQLEKTERGLDEIQRTTQMTQRNLNSLKSVFGGFFKNKFSRAPKEPAQTASVPPSKSASQLGDTVGNLNSSSSYPSSSGQRTLNESSRNAIKGTRWEAMDNQIDENLDAMSSNLRNLQMLGTALGREVEDQNRMLDRIQDKADRNDSIVRHQDAQMKRLLGIKGVEAPKDTAAFSKK